jgi:signal transduction histidine kinase
MQWGNPPKGEDDEMAPQPNEARNEILELIKRLTDSREIVRFDADPNLLSIVNERQADSAQAILDNFERIAASQPDSNLANEARRLKREMNAVLKDRAEAASEAHVQRRLRILGEKQLETERHKNKILRGLVTPPEEQRAVLQHWVGIVAGKIRSSALGLISKLQKDDVDPDTIERTIQGLAGIQFESQKLLTLADLVVESGFKMQKQKTTNDLNRFFFECLDHESRTAKVNIEVAWRPEDVFSCAFKPVEIAMIVDNLVDNAAKAGARKMRWTLEARNKLLTVRVANDGRPLADHMRSVLFEIGATSTHGHGLGLFTCRQIAREMRGEMIFLGNDSNLGGAAFEMKFGK